MHQGWSCTVRSNVDYARGVSELDATFLLDGLKIATSSTCSGMTSFSALSSLTSLPGTTERKKVLHHIELLYLYGHGPVGIELDRIGRRKVMLIIGF